MCSRSGFLAFLAMLLFTSEAWAVPLSSSNLWGAPVQTVGPYGGSGYNPRIEGDYNYGTRIGNSLDSGIARFLFNSTTAEQTSPWGVSTAVDQRMNLPYPGASPAYVLASGGNDAANPTVGNTLLTRYSYTDYSVISTATTGSVALDSFDWIDSNTIIGSSYLPSSTRKTLYTFDIGDSGGNLTVTPVGSYPTPVTTRIRSVNAGNTYTGYAYYGDGNNNANPGFYALNLATGTSTLLGNAGTLTGGGSFGLWTVKEAGGYLYVQTTDNGIQVYNMTNATTLGSLVTTYDKATIDALFPSVTPPTQFYGFDVSADGSRMVLSNGYANVLEILATPLAGDANIDRVVNVADLTNLLNNYNKTGQNWYNGDFDRDGTVNVADLTALLNNYNKTGGAVANASLGSSVPEPSSMVLLATLSAVLGAWVIRRRSR